MTKQESSLQVTTKKCGECPEFTDQYHVDMGVTMGTRLCNPDCLHRTRVLSTTPCIKQNFAAIQQAVNSEVTVPTQVATQPA